MDSVPQPINAAVWQLYRAVWRGSIPITKQRRQCAREDCDEEMAHVFAALAIAGRGAARAAEKLKVAIPQKGFWDSSWVEFGEAAGFFKEAGLEVEVFYTEGGAQTIATVVSGSVDIALSNGILGAIGAYVKGGDATPYRIISAEMTGAHELFWWVKADSPIKTLKDAAEGKTIAFSSPGSSSNLILLTLLRQAGSKAKPVPTGGAPGDLHPDHDRPDRYRLVGGAVGLAGRRRRADPHHRPGARSDGACQPDHPRQSRQRQFAQDQARGDHEVHAGYPEVDRLGLQQPAGDRDLRQQHEGAHEIAKQGVDEFYPKSAMQIGEIRDLERSLKDALDYKFIPSAKTPKDIEGLIDIVYKPK